MTDLRRVGGPGNVPETTETGKKEEVQENEGNADSRVSKKGSEVLEESGKEAQKSLQERAKKITQHVAPMPTPPAKKGFWARLFGKKEVQKEVPVVTPQKLPSVAAQKGQWAPLESESVKEDWARIWEKKKGEKLDDETPGSFLRDVAGATYILGGEVLKPEGEVLEATDEKIKTVNRKFHTFLSSALETAKKKKPEESALNAFRYQLQDLATQRLFGACGGLEKMMQEYAGQDLLMKGAGVEYDFTVENNRLTVTAKKGYSIKNSEEAIVGTDELRVQVAIDLEKVDLTKLLTEQKECVTARFSTLWVPVATKRDWTFATEFAKHNWADVAKKELKEATPESFTKALGSTTYTIGTTTNITSENATSTFRSFLANTFLADTFKAQNKSIDEKSLELLRYQLQDIAVRSLFECGDLFLDASKAYMTDGRLLTDLGSQKMSFFVEGDKLIISGEKKFGVIQPPAETALGTDSLQVKIAIDLTAFNPEKLLTDQPEGCITCVTTQSGFRKN